MADADFWRDLAARFRALPNDHGMFCIDWKQSPHGQGRIWIPRGTPSVMAQFDAVAVRAGAAIESSYLDYRIAWLEALLREGPNVGLSETSGIALPPTEGKIKNPGEASADFCNTLELRAVESQARMSRETKSPSETTRLSPSAPARFIPDARESMLDSEFWRDLAERFRPIDPHQLLRADWHYRVKIGAEPPAVAEWRLVGTDRHTRSIQFEFEALARRGGPKVYPVMESLTGWLEALRGYQLNAETHGIGIESRPDGTILSRLYSGSIVQICKASVDLCKLLESMALETERMKNNQRQHQPKEKPTPAMDANDAAKNALSLLESRSGFPKANVRIHEWLLGNKIAEQLGSTAAGCDARMEVVLKSLNIRAEAYLQLVDDLSSQRAFVVALDKIKRTAWVEFADFPFEEMNLESPEAQRRLNKIIAAIRHWENEGFKKLASLIGEKKALDATPATTVSQSDKTDESRKAERSALRDQYFASFPEKIMILDVCWAAKQRYREWTRWIGGELKDRFKPDRAFRAVLTSGKRPEDYRPEPRPKRWK